MWRQPEALGPSHCDRVLFPGKLRAAGVPVRCGADLLVGDASRDRASGLFSVRPYDKSWCRETEVFTGDSVHVMCLKRALQGGSASPVILCAPDLLGGWVGGRPHAEGQACVLWSKCESWAKRVCVRR